MILKSQRMKFTLSDTTLQMSNLVEVNNLNLRCNLVQWTLIFILYVKKLKNY